MGGRHRLVEGDDRQFLGAGGFWGARTGPNPTDRGKAGSKHHVLTDGRGVPLAASLTAANVHDSRELLALVDAVPAVRGAPGRPRRRPAALLADKAYDSAALTAELRRSRIVPRIARRGRGRRDGLGRRRWVVERTLAWLHQNRRLRVRYERRDDIHEALLRIGCVLICLNKLQEAFC